MNNVCSALNAPIEKSGVVSNADLYFLGIFRFVVG